MAILSVPVKTMMKIVLVMAGAMTVLHKRLTCILTARQNMNFFSIISGYEPITKCNLTIGGDAIIVGGIFDNTVINNGKISGGQFSSSSSLTNHGTITGGLFSSVSNESDGKIENGTFRSTVTNNGTIKGGLLIKTSG